MGKIKFILAFIFIVVLLNPSTAQTGIYTTYEDFAAGKLDTTKDEISYSSNPIAGLTLTFTANDGSVIKKKTKEIWGFLFKGSLFRTLFPATSPVRDVAYPLTCSRSNPVNYNNKQNPLSSIP